MWLHTKNTEHCLSHLEKALVQAKPLSNMEEVTLEITSLLASVYMKQVSDCRSSSGALRGLGQSLMGVRGAVDCHLITA